MTIDVRPPKSRSGGDYTVKGNKRDSVPRRPGLRGCGEGWASHFSVHARKESALIIEFVSGSHVAELMDVIKREEAKNV